MKNSFRRMLSAVLLLCVALLPAVALAEGICETVEISIDVPADLPSPDECFAGYAEREMYRPVYGDIALFGTLGADQLAQESERLLYQQLKPAIEEVAGGKRSSAEFTFTDPAETFGCAFSYTAADLGNVQIAQNGKFTAEAKAAFFQKVSDDMNYRAVLTALLNDCPYDLYWFHKSHPDGGLVFRASIAYKGGRMYLSKCTFAFRAVEPYGSQYTLDLSQTGATAAAVKKAQEIVAKHQDKTDLEKLAAYRDEICQLTGYDHSAAGSASGSYGDPWQLIHVFDGRSDTNVVCEGYAKAFQYLCDLSTFDGVVNCYSVTGTMSGGTGAGRHMWNILERNCVRYLVDVTNSDSGTAGQSGGLFMVNTPAGDWQTEYAFPVGSRTITYTYDTTMQQFWGAEVLDLLEEDPHTPGETVIENATAATCTQEGSYEEAVYCTACGEELSRTTGTTEKLPHTPGEAVVENASEGICETGGTYETAVYCIACGVELDRQLFTVAENAMHTDENDDGCCDICQQATVLVTFFANDGTERNMALQLSAGVPVMLPECSFAAPVGMYFAGWAEAPDGAPVKQPLTLDRDLILYAVWASPAVALPPQTGDAAPVGSWLLLAVLSMICAGMLTARGKRKLN